MFMSSKNYHFIKKSLSSVNSARAQSYSSCFFGNEKWYCEDFDFEKLLLHPNDRRKIRFGLKSNVDFLIQLDLQNLKDCLANDAHNSENFLDRLSNKNPTTSGNSLLGMMQAAAPSKAKDIVEILSRIESNLHFSQSLNEFFATNQKINSARLVILEAMKKGPDIGAILRGGSFAAAANAYLHVTSPFDYETAYFRYGSTDNLIQTYNRNPRTSTRNSGSATHISTSRRTNTNRPKRFGYCFRFNGGDRCSFGNQCQYTHRCSNCESPRHGENRCPEVRDLHNMQVRNPRRYSSDAHDTAPSQ